MDFSVYSPALGNIDPSCFRLWLAGLGVEQTAERIRAEASKLQRIAFVLAQFRVFETLAESICANSTHLVVLSAATMQSFTTQYYQYDARVVQELLGKRLNRARNIDDIVTKTGVPLVACRRMLENLKRIVKRVEDSDGPIPSMISTHFHIPLQLAKRYSYVLFINTHRLDTTRKRLAAHGFIEFERVASLLVEYVTSADDQDEIDAGVAQDSRDLKVLMFNKDAIEMFRNAVNAKILMIATEQQQGCYPPDSFNTSETARKNNLSRLSFVGESKEESFSNDNYSPKIAQESPKFQPKELRKSIFELKPGGTQPSTPQLVISMNDSQTISQTGIQAYKVLFRNILTLGSSIATPKEFRDFFSTLLEKVVDVSVVFGWTPVQFNIFLRAIMIVFNDESASEDNGVKSGVRRRYSRSLGRLVEIVRMGALGMWGLSVNVNSTSALNTGY